MANATICGTFPHLLPYSYALLSKGRQKSIKDMSITGIRTLVERYGAHPQITLQAEPLPNCREVRVLHGGYGKVLAIG